MIRRVLAFALALLLVAAPTSAALGQESMGPDTMMPEDSMMMPEDSLEDAMMDPMMPAMPEDPMMMPEDPMMPDSSM